LQGMYVRDDRPDRSSQARRSEPIQRPMKTLKVVSAIASILTAVLVLLAIWAPVGDLQSRLLGTAFVTLSVALLTGPAYLS